MFLLYLSTFVVLLLMFLLFARHARKGKIIHKPIKRKKERKRNDKLNIWREKKMFRIYTVSFQWQQARARFNSNSVQLLIATKRKHSEAFLSSSFSFFNFFFAIYQESAEWVILFVCFPKKKINRVIYENPRIWMIGRWNFWFPPKKSIVKTWISLTITDCHTVVLMGFQLNNGNG